VIGMVKVVIKAFEHTGIADGKRFEEEWTSDAHYLIKWIFFKRWDGEAFTKTKVTVKIHDHLVTVDRVLASTFGADPVYAIPIGMDIERDWDFKYAGTNEEGVTIDFSVELVMELKGR